MFAHATSYEHGSHAPEVAALIALALVAVALAFRLAHQR